ncbi:MAG TPA: alpha-glucan family phosphorylase [Candidatus Nanoarchaeia archaeon]|nr:alpha-glucan family phosphorylase [Candidatus Nanoarchaeia archaeon]
MKDVRVGYYSAEFGIEGLPFGGGLGILAGDATKSFADLGLPVACVGLLYGKGPFHQKLSHDGWQTEEYHGFDPTGRMVYHPKITSVPIEGRNVGISAWILPITGITGKVVPLIYLDTNGNNDDRDYDDRICDVLYPSEHLYHRLTQEQVLGKGGLKSLDALGYKDIKVHHANEGHAALAGLELIAKYGSIEEARKHFVFTTHTPVPAGLDVFPKQLAEQVLREGMPSADYMKKLTGADDLNMARLAMALSSQAFGVSPLHAEVSRYMFADFPNMKELYSVDNGVHLATWTSPQVQRLYDNLTNREWRLNPEKLERILELSEDQVLNAHGASRKNLGHFLANNPRARSNSHYDPHKLTIGFARRFATYKQATLIFEDIDRLVKLGQDVQFVFAGKSHPSDEPGKRVIQQVFRHMDELKGKVSIWFIEDYDMQVAKYLVRGVDVWLNNPERLLEASGTSGMKAAANFVPQLSVLDGWSVPQEPSLGYTLPKGLVEGVTGWAIGRAPSQQDFIELLGPNADDKRREDRKTDTLDLYGKLENMIVPLFKKDKKAWARIMRAAAAHNAPWFNSHRMVNQYFERAYNPLLEEKLAA